MKVRRLLPPCRAAALAAVLTVSPMACRHKEPSAGGTAGSPAASGTGSDAAQVVAEVNGLPITLAELDRHTLQRLAQDRLYEMRRQVLDEMVADRLLEKEAAARGISKDELLKKEVEDKAPPPSEPEIKVRFEMSGLAARGATLQQMRPQIERAVHEQRKNERRQVFLDELKSRAQVRIALQEPRTEVAVPAEAPMLGPADAPVTMVEFLDYQCSFCHRVQPMVDDILARYPGKVRFVHRDYLLGNPRSLPAARAARCAGEQGRFWEYHRRLLLDTGDLGEADLRAKAAALGMDPARFSACLASDRHDGAIQRAAAQGQSVGVSGTPTFFINGRRVVGVRPVEHFQQVIDEELKRSAS